MFDFDEIAEPEAAEEKEDPEQVAREAAEGLRDAAWQVRFGACRALESVGAAAAPHAKILARVAAKDKEADVRKAAQGVLNALRSSGVALPADYLDDYANEGDDDRARSEKKKQREEAWAERRKQREKEWEEKQKVLQEQERLEEERRRREDQLLYQQYEQYYAEAPSQPGPSMDAGSFPSAPVEAEPPPPRPALYRPGKSRGSAFAAFEPPPPEFNPRIIHPAYAPPQEDLEFEYEPEDDFEAKEAEERAEREKELQQKQEQLDEKKRQKAEGSDRVPEEVPWDGPRANIRVFGDILPMRLEREDVTPFDLGEIWEKRWGIPYASHIKFEAPEESNRKFMQPREDLVPLHPAVVTLSEKAGSVLTSLATALREYGGLLPEEAEAVRLGKLQQSLASVEKRQKANARERERLHVKEVRSRAKIGTYQERQDKRVMEMRGIVHQALGVASSSAGTMESGRPQRGMRELKRSSLS